MKTVVTTHLFGSILLYIMFHTFYIMQCEFLRQRNMEHLKINMHTVYTVSLYYNTEIFFFFFIHINKSIVHKYKMHKYTTTNLPYYCIKHNLFVKWTLFTISNHHKKKNQNAVQVFLLSFPDKKI